MSSDADAVRRAGLRRMKLVATGFLLVAAVVYFVSRWLEHRDGADAAAWVGYMRAASEAGMVGALADWFAVTAFFRQPLGLPIPHTALIKRKKDQIGDQLGGFMEQNFLTPDVIEKRVATLDLPGRVSAWISDPSHAPQISDEVARVMALIPEMLADEDVERFIMAIMRWAAEPEWGPPAGRVLEQLIDEDRIEPVIQLLCDRAHEWAVDSQDLIDRVVDRDGPSWSPKLLNMLVGERIHRELIEFTAKVRDDRNHELRGSMRAFAAQFADDLQHDPVMIARVEQVKSEFIGRDEVTGAASTAWNAGKAVIDELVNDPNGTMRTSMTESIVRIGARIAGDSALQRKMTGWTVRVARHIAANYSQEIISIVTETVRGWDAEDTSRKIELQVGRDLQFIRINGTIVGALAGLVIYSISVLLFH